MDLSKLKVDQKSAVDGVWVDLDETSKIKIARYGNSHFKTRLREVLAPYKRMIDNETLSDEKSDDLMMQVVAETILLDWKGMTMNGEEVEYSTAKAKELLIDPSLSEFRELTMSLSRDMQLFREQELEESVKK